jgi:hypothetical protein
MFDFDQLYKLMLEYLFVIVLTTLALQITLLFVRTLIELYYL